MELFQTLLQIFGHLDETLLALVRDYGAWTYGILFLIVFCETGLVVTPFLPGDSLLFSAGALAAVGSMDVALLIVLLSVAAILGDAVNYTLGATVVSRFLLRSRFVNKEHLARTERFYQRHGGKAIVIARFAPFLRTFAPFVAGMARMSYPRFAAFNVVGGIAWVGSCCLLGYFFGNIPFVKENFSAVILAIVFLSLIPAVAAYLRSGEEVTKAA
ncbi:MAG TPA: DedA family protein [Vicinamibacteria bacterium]